MLVQYGFVSSLELFAPDTKSDAPIYRQLADSIRNAIAAGEFSRGTRLPATRELAGQLGLNRSTVSAAYAILEQSGLLAGQVGRGSFVAAANPAPGPSSKFNWEAVLTPLEPWSSPVQEAVINFASSRPPDEFFPLAAFRRLARQVIDGPNASEILQLGSPFGYGPLRRHLLSESMSTPAARSGDDLIITNGCQQAFDLLARVLVSSDSPVLLEMPVYHGLLRVFGRARANVIPVPVGDGGIDLGVLEALVKQHRPRLLVVTPEFQNPTGSSLNLDARHLIVALAQRSDLIVVENNIYRELRYRGEALPSLKQLDDNGNVILDRQLFKDRFSRSARWLGTCPQAGCCPPGRSQTDERSALRSALPGGAPAFCGVG